MWSNGGDSESESPSDKQIECELVLPEDDFDPFGLSIRSVIGLSVETLYWRMLGSKSTKLESLLRQSLESVWKSDRKVKIENEIHHRDDSSSIAASIVSNDLEFRKNFLCQNNTPCCNLRLFETELDAAWHYQVGRKWFDIKPDETRWDY